MLDGAICVFLADALFLPTALLTAAFLTRRLGPDGYGLFALAFTLVTWVEWCIVSIFSPATVKLVGGAEDWRPAATTALRLYLVASGAAALLLWLLAAPVSMLLNEPVLITYLRLFALHIPIFSLANAHKNILTGLGGFRQRALATASRWITRLLLIVLLVELGLSVPGAILGSIGAALIDLAIGRFYTRPPLLRRSNFPARRLWGYAVPLFLSALSLMLYSRLDLLALKVLGGTAAQAGIYGAAQSLSLAPAFLAVSFPPILLSTLSRTLRAGDSRLAREISRNAMRAVIWLVPFAGLIAGAAQEIVGLIFGPMFSAGAPLLALLIFGEVALVMISIAMAILTAAGKPRWTFALGGPLIPLAIAGHLLLIPQWGAIGASFVTMLLAILGALAAALAVYRIWHVLPSAATLWRGLLICGFAYALAAIWPSPGVLVLLKLPAIGIIICISFLLLGEFSDGELALARAALRWRMVPEQKSGGM